MVPFQGRGEGGGGEGYSGFQVTGRGAKDFLGYLKINDFGGDWQVFFWVVCTNNY